MNIALWGIAGLVAAQPWAAVTGLALVMTGAVLMHVRRREFPALGPSGVLLILAAIVAWGRFGPYAF
ncbi:DoxX family protein [Jidongwangia harbinensis]|uniref:DoxX family protein n=1 Tax=Jidongwangia harbinensis TaxID=2878561 RepID=UPI001CD93590|nr:DoxX family protein [Jidongwangia harbinensis]MCA2211653.1 DoxX family protein [Jidongwangia harbinensis]